MSLAKQPGSILVPLDGSKNAEAAVSYAAALARLFGSPVKFIHVADEEEGLHTPEDLARARSGFAEYASGLAATVGVTDATHDVISGSPAETLLSASAGASYIVIASHGRGGFRATVVGSVADKVVRGARCPVLLVPGEGTAASVRKRVVLIALDGSQAAEEGLALGREFASGFEAPVALVRAWKIPVYPTAGFDYQPMGDIVESLEQAAKEYVARVALPGEQTVVALGDPATEICQAAVQLDAGVVVVSSSGKGLAKRITLGSTTDRLMHSLHRPLLIVPVGE